MAHGDGRPADPLDSRLSQRIVRLRSSDALGKALLRLVDQCSGRKAAVVRTWFSSF